jgi:hypothetical protein
MHIRIQRSIELSTRSPTRVRTLMCPFNAMPIVRSSFVAAQGEINATLTKRLAMVPRSIATKKPSRIDDWRTFHCIFGLLVGLMTCRVSVLRQRHLACTHQHQRRRRRCSWRRNSSRLASGRLSQRKKVQRLAWLSGSAHDQKSWPCVGPYLLTRMQRAGWSQWQRTWRKMVACVSG